jgi:hypothetical protein
MFSLESFCFGSIEPGAVIGNGLTVPLLMNKVKQLAPADLREFQKQLEQLAVWHQQNGSGSDEERTLVQTCGLSLPSVEWRRLKRLVAKSERGTLTRDELHDYRTLSHRAEQIDATRLEALTRLARLWRKPVCDSGSVASESD